MPVSVLIEKAAWAPVGKTDNAANRPVQTFIFVFITKLLSSLNTLLYPSMIYHQQQQCKIFLCRSPLSFCLPREGIGIARCQPLLVFPARGSGIARCREGGSAENQEQPPTPPTTPVLSLKGETEGRPSMEKERLKRSSKCYIASVVGIPYKTVSALVWI